MSFCFGCPRPKDKLLGAGVDTFGRPARQLTDGLDNLNVLRTKARIGTLNPGIDNVDSPPGQRGENNRLTDDSATPGIA